MNNISKLSDRIAVLEEKLRAIHYSAAKSAEMIRNPGSLREWRDPACIAVQLDLIAKAAT
jgi:hypothetical protein